MEKTHECTKQKGRSILSKTSKVTTMAGEVAIGDVLVMKALGHECWGDRDDWIMELPGQSS